MRARAPGYPLARERAADDAGAPEGGGAAPGPSLDEIPVPEPGAGEVLISVHAASICGTDLHIYDWNEWAQKRIDRRADDVRPRDGRARSWPSGAEVAPSRSPARSSRPRPTSFCGHCRHVPDRPRAHLREPPHPGRRHRRRVRRVRRHPGRERVGGGPAHPARRRPRSWSRSATPCTPSSPAGGEDIAHGDRRRPRLRADRAVRAGDRARGRRAAGDRRRAERVTGATWRRRWAPTSWSIPTKDDPVEAVRAATDGRGAEVVLEMSGVSKVIDQGTRMLDHGGRMSLLGLPDRAGDARPHRPGHLQGGAHLRRHRPRAVPHLAADDDPARHRAWSTSTPSSPTGSRWSGSRRRSRRSPRAGPARSSCSPTD